MKDLKGAFRERAKWHNNRASTFFPVFFNEEVDTYLVFQDLENLE